MPCCSHVVVVDMLFGVNGAIIHCQVTALHAVQSPKVRACVCSTHPATGTHAYRVMFKLFTVCNCIALAMHNNSV